MFGFIELFILLIIILFGVLYINFRFITNLMSIPKDISCLKDSIQNLLLRIDPSFKISASKKRSNWFMRWFVLGWKQPASMREEIQELDKLVKVLSSRVDDCIKVKK